MNSQNLTIRLGILCVAFASLHGSLNAQSYVELKKAMDATDVIEKVGKQIALDSRFKNLDGNWYSLKEFFYTERPVFLTLNYANCPQLCQNQLKGLADQFAEADMVPGKDFEFISISIDPREPQIKTRKARESFCRLLGGKSDLDGVHFLVGKKADIDSVANSIGFVYSYVASANHYSHPPVCVTLSPSGKISRYIHGLGVTAEQLTESKTIAADNKVETESIASFVYRCLLFGVNPGAYTNSMMGLMRIGGAATVIVLGACVIPFWIRSQKQSKAESTQSDDEKSLSEESQNS